jgi:hypothetical protein
VLRIDAGDQEAGDVVTIVPKAGLVTVEVTVTSGTSTISGSLQITASCPAGTTTPGCS